MLLNFSSTLVSGITFLEAVGIFSSLPGATSFVFEIPLLLTWRMAG